MKVQWTRVALLETLLGAWDETNVPSIITEITRNKNARQNCLERTQKRFIMHCNAL
jgi:hypothetical protein